MPDWCSIRCASAAAAGAKIANYTRLETAARRGELWYGEVRDVLTDSCTTIAARAVVNAAGPWADRLPQSRVHLRLTKGVHLVVDRSRLNVPDAVVMTEGSRILFAIPWGERLILGTTDTDYQGPPEAVRTDPADVQYVLDVVNDTFPAVRLTPADVLATWSGLRPLIADPHGRPSDISRRHTIAVPQPGWIDVAGGKLTTYRLIAQQTVNTVFSQLGRTPARTAVPPTCLCSTGLCRRGQVTAPFCRRR